MASSRPALSLESCVEFPRIEGNAKGSTSDLSIGCAAESNGMAASLLGGLRWVNNPNEAIFQGTVCSKCSRCRLLRTLRPSSCHG
jgi:hypothetical protein